VTDHVPTSHLLPADRLSQRGRRSQLPGTKGHEILMSTGAAKNEPITAEEWQDALDHAYIRALDTGRSTNWLESLRKEW
jgi:hypothetical protein